VEACAYGRPGSGRDGVPAALCLGLEIKDLFGSAGDQALVVRDQEMGSVNFPAEGRAGYRSAPSTHGYPLYAARGKRSVFSRVPTHIRLESPRSRRKTLYVQYGGCAGHAQICLLTTNSGLATISPTVCLFLAILALSGWRKAVPQRGPLVRGRPVSRVASFLLWHHLSLFPLSHTFIKPY
jgi:hypothetical protein